MALTEGGARRGRTQQGSAALEFALVMPILLILVFGAIQYGLYFWAKQGGADAARYAARTASTGAFPECTDFQSDAENEVGDVAQGDPTVTRIYSKSEGNTDSDVQVGDRVTVTVSFDSMDFNFPFVPFLNDGLVTETAQARVDNVTDQPEDCS